MFRTAKNLVSTLLTGAVILAASACSDREVVAPGSGVEVSRVAASSVEGVTPMVSTGGRATCSLRSTGVVNCWGWNTFFPQVHAAGAGHHFVQIVVGYYGICGLREDGVIACGESATPISGGPYTRFSWGLRHLCAIRPDGVIECRRTDGGPDPWEPGDAAAAPPTRTALSGFYIDVDAGYQKTCGLRNDGVIECWGVNSYGEAPPVRTAATGYYVHMDVGPRASCGVRNDGVIECWGENDRGEAPATKTASVGGFAEVSVGTFFGCAIRTDGNVECWGDNSTGRAPSLVTPRSGSFVQIESSCAMRSDGYAECWGENSDGALLDDHDIVFTTTPPNPVYRFYVADAYSTSGLEVRIKAIGENCTSRNDTIFALPGETGVCLVRATSQTDSTYAKIYREQSFQFDTLTPTPPGTLTGTAVSAQRIDLQWGASDRVLFYELRRRVRSRVNGTVGQWQSWQTIARLDAPQTSYSDTTVEAEHEYRYTVSACGDGCAVGPNELQLKTPDETPAAPSQVKGTPASATAIVVTWRDNSPIETRYQLFRQVQNQSWQLISSPGANVETYRDSALTSGLTYRYQIRACRGTACSAYAISPFVMLAAPPAPGSFSAALASDPTRVLLSWTLAAQHGDDVRLYRRQQNPDASFTAWALIATLPHTATSYPDSAVVPGTRYDYRTRVCNAIGCSAYVSTSATLPPRPAVVPTVTARYVPSVSEVRVEWTYSPNSETYFAVFRRSRVGDGAWSAFEQRGTAVASRRAYRDAVPATATSYQYRVRACNAASCSAASSSADVAVP